MSMPLIWIIFPGALGLLMLGLLRWRRLVTSIGTITAMVLGLMAIWLPIAELTRIGPIAFVISDGVEILGRRLILEPNERPVLILLYLGAAFWFGGSYVAKTDHRFVPLGLGITAMLTAALLVEPFLYAALIFEIIILCGVVLLFSPGIPPGHGILRFMTFETLSMPFILLLGWLLSGIQADPGNVGLVGQVAVIAGLGFALMLPIFPFHTWIPMVMEEAHPYVAAFIFYVITIFVPIFILNFLEQNNWLYTSSSLLAFLRISGVLMVLIGGIGAAFQHNLGRLLGSSVLLELGYILLCLSAGVGNEINRENLTIIFAMILPRSLSFGVWALGIALMRSKTGNLDFSSLRGLGRNMAITVISIFLAILSLVGFPITAGFLVRLASWQILLLQFPLAAYAALIGSIGLLIGGLRGMAVMVMGSGEPVWRISENRGERILLLCTSGLILIIGLIPQWFYPSIFSLARTFLRLGG